jgi:hypothetical protein
LLLIDKDFGDRFGLGKQIKREMLIFSLVFKIGRDQE